MEYLTLGRIVKVVGLKGEVKVYSSTDFPYTRYKKNNKLFLFNEKDNTRVDVSVASYREDGVFDVVSFKGLQDINAAEKYVQYLVQVEKNPEELEDGYYFYSDLEKCSVYDEDNNLLGKVKTVESFTTKKTLRVSRKDQNDFFVPFVKAFIKEVNIQEEKIIIHVIEGLL